MLAAKGENAVVMPRVRVSNGDQYRSVRKRAHHISERPVNMRMTVRIMTKAMTYPMTVSGHDNDKCTGIMMTKGQGGKEEPLTATPPLSI